MTRKLTISVPDDVAMALEGIENVSGYFTELARRDQRRATGMAMLAQAGYQPTEAGMDALRERMAEARRKIEERKARTACGTT